MKFAYTTANSIEGVNYTSSELKKLIHLYSNKVNKFTNKTFAPVNATYRFDAASSVYKIPGAPVLKVNNVEVINKDGFRLHLNENQFDILDNTLIRLNIANREGLASVEVSLKQGYLEDLKEVEVELLSPISSGTTEVSLSDVSELDERDVLVFGKHMFIIDSISYDLNKVVIEDPGNILEIPAGRKTTCFGCVPIQIEEVIRLFVKNHEKIQSGDSWIRNERVGNYSYQLDRNPNSLTGISEIDSILFLFINDEIDITFL